MISTANARALAPPASMIDPAAVVTLVCEGAAVWTVVGAVECGTVPLMLIEGEAEAVVAGASGLSHEDSVGLLE